MEPKYPNVEVDFSNINGNAFSLIGAVRRALRRSGVSGGKLEEFQKEATSGDYDNVIQTCMRWVNVV